MKEAADVIVSSKNIEFLKLIEELVEKSPGNGFWLADGNYEIISSFGNKNKINFLRSYIHVGKNLEPALKDLLSLPNEVLKVEWDSLKETLGRLLSNPAHLKWFLKEIYSNKLNHVPADLKIYLDQKDLSTKKEVLKFLSNNQQSPWGCTLGEAASRIFNGKDDIELYKPFAKTEFPCLKKHLGFIGQQLILANDSCSQKLNNFSKFLKEFPGFEFHNFEKLLSNCSTFCESKSDCSYGECTLSQPRNVAFRDVYKNNCNRDSKSEIRAPSDVQCLKNHCIESGIKPNDCSASKVFSNIKNEISKRGGFSCKTNNDCIRSNSHPFRFYTNDQFEKSFKLRIVDDYTYRCKNSELKDFPSRLFSNDEQPALCTNGQCVNNLNVDAKIKAFNSYQIECEKEIQIEKTGVFINACKFAKANKTRIEEADYLIYDLLRSCGANDYLERRNPNLQKPSAEQLKCALNRYQQSPYFKSNQ
ncbi:MAG: hypothetical protein H7336_05515 [Bacteriovorax sp.]|nr:hypothetical protein [Bacteriovorax sp.]